MMCTRIIYESRNLINFIEFMWIHAVVIKTVCNDIGRYRRVYFKTVVVASDEKRAGRQDTKK